MSAAPNPELSTAQQPSGIARVSRDGQSFVVDFDNRCVTSVSSSSRRSLRPQPFKILCCLLRTPGALIKTKDLERELWTSRAPKYAIHGVISDLRRAFDDTGHQAIIVCQPLVGFRFAGDVQWKTSAVTSPEPPSAAKAAQPPRIGIDQASEAQAADNQNFLTDTGFERLNRLYLAVHDACHAGRFREGFELLQYQVWRKPRADEFYSERMFGLVGADLAALAGFYKSPWTRFFSGLSPEEEAGLLVDTGFRLRALGRLSEATEAMTEGLRRFKSKPERLRDTARTARFLSEIYLAGGDLQNADSHARDAIKFAQAAFNFMEVTAARIFLAYILNKRGKRKDVEELIASIDDKLNPHETTFLAGEHNALIAFAYCGTLIDAELHLPALTLIERGLPIARKQNWLRAIGLHLVARSRAHAAELVLATRSDNKTELISEGTILHDLEEAVKLLRDCGQRDYLPYALLARADFYWRIGDPLHSAADVNAVLEIAEPAQMRLHAVDGHLLRARLEVASDNHGAGRADLLEAARLVRETGYHQRDASVAEISKMLGLSLEGV